MSTGSAGYKNRIIYGCWRVVCVGCVCLLVGFGYWALGVGWWLIKVLVCVLRKCVGLLTSGGLTSGACFIPSGVFFSPKISIFYFAYPLWVFWLCPLRSFLFSKIPHFNFLSPLSSLVLSPQVVFFHKISIFRSVWRRGPAEGTPVPSAGPLRILYGI